MLEKCGNSKGFIGLLFWAVLSIGCANLLSDVAKGADPSSLAVGAAATEVIHKTKEVLTPHFPLYLQPLELCYLQEDYTIAQAGKPEQNVVTCVITPCEGKCEVHMPFSDFLKRSPKFTSLESVSKVFNAIQNFCDKNGEVWCKKQLFEFSKDVSGEIVLLGK